MDKSLFNLKLRYHLGHIAQHVNMRLPKKQRYPKAVLLEVTDACNLSCSMCPVNNPEAVRRKKRSFMEFELFRQAVDEIATFAPCHLQPQGGGEPLLHPQFEQMLRYARKKPAITIGFNTNAMALDEHWARLLVELKIDEIGISLDAHDAQSFKEITGKDGFEKVNENIHRLIEVKQETGSTKPMIKLLLVIMDENNEYVSDYINKWIQLADQVCIQAKRDMTGRKVPQPLIPPRRPHPCTRLFTTAVVNAKGELVLCCEDWDSQVTFGCIKDKSILELWNSPKYEAFRKRHLSGNVKGLTLCQDCYVLCNDHIEFERRQGLVIQRSLAVETYTRARQ